ncbi:MAG: LCP family protein [Oscillospiraceae bacterium]|nr:LCP family protein [Oscillospiraceae bacterium]
MATKKKKSGHVAIPFLLTLLLGIVGIGGIATYLFNKIGLNKDHIIEWNSAVKKPTAADNMTVLFILHEEADPKPVTFLTARLLPEQKKIVFFSYPATMLALVDGKQATLEEFFNAGGASMVETAIENESGIHTDRYAIVGSEGFQKICNIFGGVYFVVPSGIKGFAETNTPQFLGPTQMEKLVTYPFFEGGEIDRSAMTADMITEMVNVSDSDRERILASMDSNFKNVINLMETDITAADYNDHKSALRYMFTYGKTICSFRIVTGTPGEDEDIFILSDTFYNSVKEFFAEAPEVVTIAPEEDE